MRVGVMAWVLTLGVSGGALYAAVPDLETIIEALEKRQSRVKTAELAWVKTVTYARHSMKDDQNRVFPDRDTIIERRGLLIIDGEKARYESQGKQWYVNDHTLKEAHEIWTTDGKVSMGLTTGEIVGKVPAGLIGKSASSLAVNVEARPLMIAFRPVPCLLGTTAESRQRWTIAPRLERLDGVDCVVLRDARTQGSEMRYWLAPSQDFAPLRYAVYQQGRILRQCDMKYRQDAEHGWVPAEWRSVELNRKTGAVDIQAHVVLKRVVINQPVDPGLFVLSFPPGTKVTDERAQELYVVGERNEKVLLAARHRKAAPPAAYRQWPVAVGVIVAAVCVAGSVVFWLRRRSRG